MTNLSLEIFGNGVKIYQNESLYKFTSDAIKIAKFCNIKNNDNVLDMCAGCGVVGFYAYSINKCNKLYFNEIQPQMCDLIDLNVKLNNLEDKCKILCKDLNYLSLKDVDKPLDVITCNPPYFKANGKVKQNLSIAMCRHEICVNLAQIVKKASGLLKSGGRFYIVVPADRMCECVNLLTNNRLEVKNIQMYYSNDTATVCLMESVKNAKSGVLIKVSKEGV